MAGHSKWANIKHRKAAQDAKRGKVFTKIIRELVVAAKQGGPLAEDNPALRAVIDKALNVNMKRDTIDKAIARATGGQDADNYDEITYEGYGPNGVAIMVKTLTDNRNRTVSEVRHAFTKRGGNLGTDGSVAYLFEKKGQIYLESGDEEQVMEIALEAGAEDIISNDDGSFDIDTSPESYLEVKEALTTAGITVSNGEITMVPATRVELDSDSAEKTLALVDMLEDLDDVQDVYHNAEISDDIYAKMG